MAFAPDARDGVWHSPDWLEGPYLLELVLEDDRDPPARRDHALRSPSPERPINNLSRDR